MQFAGHVTLFVCVFLLALKHKMPMLRIFLTKKKYIVEKITIFYSQVDS